MIMTHPCNVRRTAALKYVREKGRGRGSCLFSARKRVGEKTTGPRHRTRAYMCKWPSSGAPPSHASGDRKFTTRTNYVTIDGTRARMCDVGGPLAFLLHYVLIIVVVSMPETVLVDQKTSCHRFVFQFLLSPPPSFGHRPSRRGFAHWSYAIVITTCARNYSLSHWTTYVAKRR